MRMIRLGVRRESGRSRREQNRIGRMERCEISGGIYSGKALPRSHWTGELLPCWPRCSALWCDGHGRAFHEHCNTMLQWEGAKGEGSQPASLPCVNSCSHLYQRRTGTVRIQISIHCQPLAARPSIITACGLSVNGGI